MFQYQTDFIPPGSLIADHDDLLQPNDGTILGRTQLISVTSSSLHGVIISWTKSHDVINPYDVTESEVFLVGCWPNDVSIKSVGLLLSGRRVEIEKCEEDKEKETCVLTVRTASSGEEEKELLGEGKEFADLVAKSYFITSKAPGLSTGATRGIPEEVDWAGVEILPSWIGTFFICCLRHYRCRPHRRILNWDPACPNKEAPRIEHPNHKSHRRNPVSGTSWSTGKCLVQQLLILIQYIELVINKFTFGSLFISFHFVTSISFFLRRQHNKIRYPCQQRSSVPFLLFLWKVSSDYPKNTFPSKKRDLFWRESEIKTNVESLLLSLFSHKSCYSFLADVSESEKSTPPLPSLLPLLPQLGKRTLRKQESSLFSSLIAPRLPSIPVFVAPLFLVSSSFSCFCTLCWLGNAKQELFLVKNKKKKNNNRNKKPLWERSWKQKDYQLVDCNPPATTCISGANTSQNTSANFPITFSSSLPAAYSTLAATSSLEIKKETAAEHFGHKSGKKEAGKKKEKDYSLRGDTSLFAAAVAILVLVSDWLNRYKAAVLPSLVSDQRWYYPSPNRTRRTTSKIIHNLIFQASIFAASTSVALTTPIQDQQLLYNQGAFAYGYSDTTGNNIGDNINNNSSNNFHTFSSNQLNSYNSRKSTPDLVPSQNFPSKKFASNRNESNNSYHPDSNNHPSSTFEVQSQSIWKRFNQILSSSSKEPVQVFTEETVYIRDSNPHLPNLQSPLFAYSTDLHNR